MVSEPQQPADEGTEPDEQAAAEPEHQPRHTRRVRTWEGVVDVADAVAASHWDQTAWAPTTHRPWV